MDGHVHNSMGRRNPELLRMSFCCSCLPSARQNWETHPEPTGPLDRAAPGRTLPGTDLCSSCAVLWRRLRRAISDLIGLLARDGVHTPDSRLCAMRLGVRPGLIATFASAPIKPFWAEDPGPVCLGQAAGGTDIHSLFPSFRWIITLKCSPQPHRMFSPIHCLSPDLPSSHSFLYQHTTLRSFCSVQVL